MKVFPKSILIGSAITATLMGAERIAFKLWMYQGWGAGQTISNALWFVWQPYEYFDHIFNCLDNYNCWSNCTEEHGCPVSPRALVCGVLFNVLVCSIFGYILLRGLRANKITSLNPGEAG